MQKGRESRKLRRENNHFINLMLRQTISEIMFATSVHNHLYY